MTHATGQREFRRFLAAGEGERVEFKRCSKGVRDDTFETVCSFLNGGGGDVFLGVEDGGTVCGVARDSVEKIVADVVRTASNPALFSPPVQLCPEVFNIGAKTLIRIRVPASAATHSYKGGVYRRIDDADFLEPLTV